MSMSTERFAKRKALLRELPSNRYISNDSVPAIARPEEEAEIIRQFDASYELSPSISISLNDIQAFREKLLASYDDDRRQRLLRECRNTVAQQIITTFGLGHLVAAYDKLGGPVDTVHNVRNIKEKREEYLSGTEYGENEKRKAHSHANYKKKNDEVNHGPVQDYMTGNYLEKGQQNLDHKVSAKEVFEDPAVYLAKLKPEDVANRELNLGFTDECLNKSKKQKSMSDFLLHEKNLMQQRDNLLQKQKDSQLSPNQEKTLDELNRKISKLEEINKENTMHHDDAARKDINNHINKTYYTSGDFLKNTTKASALQGSRMALQQATGLLLNEFFQGFVDEVIDLYKFGVQKATFLSDIKKRVVRLVERVLSRWKDAFSVGWKGFVSGLLSSLATTLLNTFFTTSRNLIRMIREGSNSGFQAIMLLVNPPPSMTWREAAHEASKIAMTGAIIVGAIGLEETLAKALGPVTVFLGSAVLPAVTGIATGIVTALAVYGIEKADLLGVEADKKARFVTENLQASLDDEVNACNILALELKSLL